MAEKNNSKTDSLDLSSVNKSSKSKKTNKTLTQNLFKKQSGPNRDEEGKFAPNSKFGSGGLVKLERFNFKRALPLVLLITILGGILVLSSYAAGSQAVVRGWYKSCLGRSADKGGLDYWSGRLDKGESQSAVLAAFKASAKVTVCDKDKTTATNSNATTTTPATNTTQQTNTTQSSGSTELESARAWIKLGEVHLKNAKVENDRTYNISLQSTVSLSNLQEIANRESEVRGKLSQMQGGKTTVQSLYNQAISKTETRKDGPAILDAINVMQTQIEGLNGYVFNIAADYKRAENVYENSLNAQVNQRQNSNANSSSNAQGKKDNKVLGGTKGSNAQGKKDNKVLGGTKGSREASNPVQAINDTITTITDAVRAATILKYSTECSLKPDYTKEVKISNGVRTELRDVYYDGSGKARCNNKFKSTVSIRCNSGYKLSGSKCVSKSNTDKVKDTLKKGVNIGSSIIKSIF